MIRDEKRDKRNSGMAIRREKEETKAQIEINRSICRLRRDWSNKLERNGTGSEEVEGDNYKRMKSFKTPTTEIDRD